MDELTGVSKAKKSLEQELQKIFWFDDGSIVEYEGGEVIEPDGGIYSVKAGKAITITVEFTDPNNKITVDEISDEISWVAEHGKFQTDPNNKVKVDEISWVTEHEKIQSVSNNSLTSIYIPPEGKDKDEVGIKLWDKETGIELIKTIKIEID